MFIAFIFFPEMMFFIPKHIVRNAFLAPKYPRVEVLLMIVAPKGQ